MCDTRWQKICNGSCTDNSTEADSKYLMKVMFPFGWNETLTDTDNTVKFGWDSWQTMTDSWFVFVLAADMCSKGKAKNLQPILSKFMEQSQGTLHQCWACLYSFECIFHDESLCESENLNLNFVDKNWKFMCCCLYPTSMFRRLRFLIVLCSMLIEKVQL